jgi:hypothetical protein
VVHDALAKNPERLAFRQLQYSLSFLDDDVNGLREQVNWAMHKAGADALLASHSNTDAYFGRLSQARELSQRAEESALHSEFRELSVLLHGIEAVREALLENTEVARRQARNVLAAAPGPETVVLVTLALAKIGDTTQARQLVDRLKRPCR